MDQTDPAKEKRNNSKQRNVIPALCLLGLWLISVLLFIKGGFALPFGPIRVAPADWQYPIWQVILASLGTLLEAGWIYWGLSRKSRRWKAAILGCFVLWAGLWNIAGIYSTGGNGLLIAHSLWMLLVLAIGLVWVIIVGFWHAPVLIRWAVLIGLPPIALYGVLLGSAPQIHAAEALEMIGRSNQGVALVDVRPLEKYQARHITGALSLPLAEILEMDSSDELPLSLQGKTLVLVCDAGVRSVPAARHLRGLGVIAYSLRGGMQDWGRAWLLHPNSPFSRFELSGGVVEEPFREMTPTEQGAAALALLWIKPIYMLLSGVLSIFLLRRKEVDLRLLGWGLLVFLIGEVFCAINYLFLQDNSYFAEYIHSYSMAIAFGLATYALMEGLDKRLVHFTEADKKCALLPVCGQCIKYQPVRCGLRRITQLLGIVLIALTFIALFAPFSYTAYNTQIGPVTHYYVRPFVQQWFEARYSPLVAIAMLGLALLVMQRSPHDTIHPLARLLFCGGAGFLGFGFYRVTLGMIYSEALIWATFWEEITELLFVAAVIYILWVFRSTLLPEIKLPQVFQKTSQ